MKKILFILVLIFPAFLDPFADRVTSGNSNYGEGNFPAAEKSYKEAEQYLPSKKTAPDLAFNMGDARYKQGDFDGAIDYYRKALESQDRNVQKKALLNIGNAYLQKNDKKAAADAYMAALKIDPNYEKAKKNLEYIYKKQNQDKQNGQNQQQQQGGNDKSGSQGKGQPQQKKSLDSGQLDRMMEMMKKKPLRRENKKGGLFDSQPDKPW
jgi:tetratricopeptide (TPR) repeat protein